MLTGVDVDELYERTTAVVAAAGQVIVGARLIAAIKTLGQGLVQRTYCKMERYLVLNASSIQLKLEMLENHKNKSPIFWGNFN